VKPLVQQPQDGAKPQRSKAANHREDSQRVAKPGQRAGKGPLPEPQDVGETSTTHSEGPATGVAFRLPAGLDK